MPDTVLITGGSGAVGQALVRRFVADQYRVAFTYCNNQAAAETLAAETGAKPFQADLTDATQVTSLAKEVLAELQEIDVLINNAGRTQVMPFALIEEEDWDEIIGANLKSMFLVTHEFVRDMIHREKGVIINVGSLAGQRLLDVPVHYATAKAGVTGFTLSLARELSRYGIRVNEIVPGLLTEGVSQHVPEDELRQYLDFCASGRAGDPEEVANVAAFLASNESSYINAQSIFVDGGI